MPSVEDSGRDIMYLMQHHATFLCIVYLDMKHTSSY